MSQLVLLARPWRSALAGQLDASPGVIRERKGLLIELRDEEGRVGVGEASPLAGFSAESLEDVVLVLSEVDPAALDVSDPVGSVERLELPPSAAHGLEQALWDLRGQREGCRVSEFFGAETAPGVAVSRLVRNVDEALAAVRQGIGTVKLKVGVLPLSVESGLVHGIRRAVGEDVQIRLDANGGWSPSEAGVALGQFAPANLELVEQPLPVGAPREVWQELRQFGVPIAADESVRDEQALQELLGVVDAVVLKPMFIGGLYRAVCMGRTAIEAGCGVVVTSSLDSGVGRFGALHVATALVGNGLLPCGLDTGGLLEDDPCPGPEVSAGFMRTAGFGLGILERTF